MSDRATFTSEELARVLSHYDLGIVAEVRPFERGSHESAKVVVRTADGRFLVKRRPHRDDPYKVAFAHSMQRFLAAKHFPLPHLIGTRANNNSMLKIGESVYEVFEYIEGERYDRSLKSTFEAGRTLGLYHYLLRDFTPKWEPPHGHFHDAEQVFNAFEPMCTAIRRAGGRGADNVDALHKLALKIRDRYQAAADEANDKGVREWEEQIVHSDWHPGNLLFEHQCVLAVLDHDSARIRPRVMDLANGVLQFSMTMGGRDVATWEMHADVDRANQFLRGYDSVNVVTRAELAALPALMQEALVAQAVRPILTNGTFAGLDGYEFLRVVLGKARWIHANLKFTDKSFETSGA
ncbi:MAG TPA: phosphotransferase [Phycisphaerae bacterium]|nr:phosphotransferase [Phycisphaerae bacterium]HRW52851.1 phosphotransferase [Phycisphaerae bacterium]